jgi:DHA3 family macrolide efflux protein-like MFS transporter
VKKFFILWSSQAASLFGSAVVNFALAWYLTRETGSATILATALMVAMIPQIVLGPFIGPLVDRWDRKKIMIFADLYVMLLTVVLVVLFYTGNTQIWHIYLIMIGRAIGETFQFPALGASIPMIVPEEHLVRANGLYQMLQAAIKIVAPPAGAFLMEALPMQGVLSVDIITAILAVACLLPLVIPRPERTTLMDKASHFEDMKQGFRYIWARRGLVMLISMVALLIFFVAPASGLIPVLVNEHLEGDVLKLGWLTSASGIGGVLGGLLLGVWGGFKKRMWTAFLGFFIMIPCSVGLGFTSPDIFYATSVPAMFFMGAGLALVNAPLGAIMNSVIAKDMQGRVFSLYGSIVTAAFPLGLVIGGPVADWLGIRSLYFIASGAWLIILCLFSASKSLMDLENQKTADKPISNNASS